jgi:1,4-alpha-glucan branching enzyme
LGKIRPSVSGREVERIVGFEESSPASVLGPKSVESDGGLTLSIRSYQPRAKTAWVKFGDGERHAMTRLEGGFYEAQFASDRASKGYTIVTEDETGYSEEREDPYSFAPSITDYDLHLIGEGTHRRAYEKLGAHLAERDGVKGVRFAVWAPNARSVSVVGDFNHWEAGEHPMTALGSSGVWELFIPRLGESELYKFAIKSGADGKVVMKTDPYAFQTELRPRTASVVLDLERHRWRDSEWMSKRETEASLEKPISIYEVHLGSWRRKGDGRDYLGYREVADKLVPYMEEMGFTHLELLPVMEHPLDDSWGYQVVNYYAPTSRFGSPLDFMYLVERCHRSGIGVILDWVPAHFPRDDYGLAMFDGTHLFEHADPRRGEHPEWGTLIFNYSRNEVRAFLISNALFWLERYHVDGLRLDAVASMLYLDYSRKPGEWTPNEYGGNENFEAVSFLKELNEAVHSSQPGTITIAEESTAWSGVTRRKEEGGLGFDLKWNMGWMHDTLDYFSRDPVHRKYHQGNLTFSLWYAFSERFILVLSHDEVVYGKRSMVEKMPGDEWQKFANLRLCYGYMFTHPGKKLIFMGNEFGQRSEWDFRKSLDWHLLSGEYHSKLQRYVRDLNHAVRRFKELHELDFTPEGFEWIDFSDAEQGVISYLRKSRGGGIVVVACNLTPVPRHNYRIGVPWGGHYREVLNSDALEYGGSGVGNLGGLDSDAVPSHGRPHSLSLTLPPLAILLLVPEGA